MSNKENGFRKRLLSTFRAEAQDHLKTISSGLVVLEKNPPAEVQSEIVETIFRASHSLKGAARAVNMPDIEGICQAIEGVFSLWKQKGITPPDDIFDALYHAIEIIRVIISYAEATPAAHDRERISRLVREFEKYEEGRKAALEENRLPDTPQPRVEEGGGEKTMVSAPPASIPVAEEHLPFNNSYNEETVRISTGKLNSLLLQSEEMLTAKLVMAQYSADLMEVSSIIDSLRDEFKNIYHEMPQSAAESMPPRFGEIFNTAYTRIKALNPRLKKLTKSARQFNKTFDRMVDSLLEGMKQATMLPFSFLTENCPMLIRGIAHEQRKDVELIVSGDSIEVDRRILEEMKDPFIHILRNCVDHGIERPQVRAMFGKSLRGRISINIAHLDGNKIEVLITDDGEGIDPSKVKEAAIKSGALSREAADSMDDEAAVSLIFQSGISTSPIITDISGRGLGLAIAREKVEKLGGSISVESDLHSGARFRLVLPLTVATFRGILVRVSGQVFIVPTSAVERTLRVREDDIKTVENIETISFFGSAVSFVRLSSILGVQVRKKREDPSGFVTVLVLSAGGGRIGFGVDEIVNEQEVLIKGLGPQLSRVRNVSGAAVLGSGRPVPVLNVSDLMRSAVKAPLPKSAPAAEEAAAERKSILVAEDSITSRILLKNILETAGYDVRTAVDGIDAFTALKTEDFDLVVSDVEMPRMNGFDLTVRIRADKKLAELPIVLVTALETREDREKGIESGANAYIVKSSFNQGNLLEVVRRLI